jgi:putative flippase GtrA
LSAAPPDGSAPRPARHGLPATALRFLAGGIVNTLATLLLYWLLLTVLPPHPAYAISFVAGIGLGYLINTGFVFGARRTWGNLAAFPLVYLAGYGAGAGVLELATARFGVDPRLAPLFSVAVSVPLTFVLMRLLLGRRRA